MAKKERINGKTPSGGDYSELVYLDENFKNVDEKDAKFCVIYEYLNDGTVVGTTYGTIEKQ